MSLICHIDIYHIGACIALLVPADLAERVAGLVVLGPQADLLTGPALAAEPGSAGDRGLAGARGFRRFRGFRGFVRGGGQSSVGALRHLGWS